MLKLAARTLIIIPEQIGFFRFILEAYDNLAILTTLDNKQGLVKLLYPRELTSEVDELLAALPWQLVVRPAPHSEPENT